MSKNLITILAQATLVVVLGTPLWATETVPEETAPAESAPVASSETVETEAVVSSDSAAKLGEIEGNSLSDTHCPPICEMCNLTGFASCETLNGTACTVAGVSQRCYIEPAWYCEWSRCRCNGTTWTCFGL